MKLFLVFFVHLVFNLSFSQVNESPLTSYTWKGKKTILSPGYVILSSGKKLEGKISLQGSSSSLSGIYFEGDGKEIDFPLKAIKAYGLLGVQGSQTSSDFYNGPLVCDNNEALFVWRDMGVQMGKQIHNTKPRTGYIIKRNGARIEGELQIKKVDNTLNLFTIKGDKGKFKIPASEVGHYGLKMTISEMTKEGEKQFKDEAKNFHRGKITLKSGEMVEGQIAFKKKIPINPNRPGAGDKYTSLFFAESEKSFVKTYTGEEVVSITQNINGEDIVYSPYEGGFVSSTTMDNAKYTKKEKQLNKGSIVLTSGLELVGEVALPNRNKANYRNQDGIIAAYNANDIDRISVSIQGEDRVFIGVEGMLMEEFFNGKTFQVYENPKPTTVNEKKTNIANNMVSMGASLASTAVLNSAEKTMGTDMSLDSIVRNSSTPDLIQARENLARVNGYKSVEEMEEKGLENKTAAKMDAALQLELGSRNNSDNIVIYYEEIIVINKSTNNKMILYKDKDVMNDKLEGLLMGCYSFLELDKKEQKVFYDIDNIKKTFKMLDSCY